MRSKLLPALLVAGLAFGGAAFAATDSTGTIKAIDVKAMTVTLDDGTVYYFPATVKLDGFTVGEKVVISWDMKDNKHEATAIKAE
jgi:Cu/Ag efflux protein CusF